MQFINIFLFKIGFRSFFKLQSVSLTKVLLVILINLFSINFLELALSFLQFPSLLYQNIYKGFNRLVDSNYSQTIVNE